MKTIRLKESELINLIHRAINEEKVVTKGTTIKPLGPGEIVPLTSGSGVPARLKPVIDKARRQGKLSGMSDKKVVNALNKGIKEYKKIESTPSGGDRPKARKWKCGNCGGGTGVCVLGGCFSGRSLTWKF